MKQEFKIGDKVQIQSDDRDTAIIVGFTKGYNCEAVVVIRDGFNSKSYWHPSVLMLIN